MSHGIVIRKSTTEGMHPVPVDFDNRGIITKSCLRNDVNFNHNMSLICRNVVSIDLWGRCYVDFVIIILTLMKDKLWFYARKRKEKILTAEYISRKYHAMMRSWKVGVKPLLVVFGFYILCEVLNSRSSCLNQTSLASFSLRMKTHFQPLNYWAFLCSDGPKYLLHC